MFEIEEIKENYQKETRIKRGGDVSGSNHKSNSLSKNSLRGLGNKESKSAGKFSRIKQTVAETSGGKKVITRTQMKVESGTKNDGAAGRSRSTGSNKPNQDSTGRRGQKTTTTTTTTTTTNQKNQPSTSGHRTREETKTTTSTTNLRGQPNKPGTSRTQVTTTKTTTTLCG